jgi:hypothetical protein
MIRCHGEGQRGVKADAEEEQSMRRRCGGGRYGIEADMEEEWTPMGVR